MINKLIKFLFNLFKRNKRVYPSAEPYTTKNVMIAPPVKKVKKKKQPKPKPSIAVCRKMYRCRHGKKLHN